MQKLRQMLLATIRTPDALRYLHSLGLGVKLHPEKAYNGSIQFQIVSSSPLLARDELTERFGIPKREEWIGRIHYTWDLGQRRHIVLSRVGTHPPYRFYIELRDGLQSDPANRNQVSYALDVVRRGLANLGFQWEIHSEHGQVYLARIRNPPNLEPWNAQELKKLMPAFRDIANDSLTDFRMEVKYGVSVPTWNVRH